MVLKQNVNTEIIYKAVYNLIEIANTNLPGNIYSKLSEFNYSGKENILKNAYIAQKKYASIVSGHRTGGNLS